MGKERHSPAFPNVIYISPFSENGVLARFSQVFRHLQPEDRSVRRIFMGTEPDVGDIAGEVCQGEFGVYARCHRFEDLATT